MIIRRAWKYRVNRTEGYIFLDKYLILQESISETT